MSILTDLARSLGIPDSTTTEADEQFRRFPALKRASREVVDLVNGDLHAKFMAIPNEFLTPDLWTRKAALRDQALASWEEGLRIEGQIVEVFKAARDSGQVDDATMTEALRQCGLQQSDLGSWAAVGVVTAVLLAAIVVWRSDALIRAVADAVVAYDRGIQLNRAEALGFGRALDVAVNQARASGKAVVIPQRPNTEKGSLQTAAETATSLGTMAVIGVGLWAAASILGGRRK